MLETLFDKVAILKTLLKKDFNTCVFPWNLQNFYEHLFLQNSSSGCFWRLTRISKESGTKTGPSVSDKYQIQLKKVFSVAKISSTSVKEIIPEFFCPFILVFILYLFYIYFSTVFEFVYDEMVLLCNMFKIFFIFI